jgi:hypothetical protein
MKLILTEIPINYRDRRFPPIFKIKSEIPYAENMPNNINNTVIYYIINTFYSNNLLMMRSHLISV